MSTELLSELTVGTEQQIWFKLPTQITNQVSRSPTVYQMLNPQIQVWCYILGLRPNVWANPSTLLGWIAIRRQLAPSAVKLWKGLIKSLEVVDGDPSPTSEIQSPPAGWDVQNPPKKTWANKFSWSHFFVTNFPDLSWLINNGKPYHRVSYHCMTLQQYSPMIFQVDPSGVNIMYTLK